MECPSYGLLLFCIVSVCHGFVVLLQGEDGPDGPPGPAGQQGPRVRQSTV